MDIDAFRWQNILLYCVLMNLLDTYLDNCIFENAQIINSKLKSSFEVKYAIKIGNILSNRINECIKNEQFKSLPIHIIFKIVDQNLREKQ